MRGIFIYLPPKDTTKDPGKGLVISLLRQTPANFSFLIHFNNMTHIFKQISKSIIIPELPRNPGILTHWSILAMQVENGSKKGAHLDNTKLKLLTYQRLPLDTISLSSTLANLREIQLPARSTLTSRKFPVRLSFVNNSRKRHIISPNLTQKTQSHKFVHIANNRRRWR